MSSALPMTAVAEVLAQKIAGLDPARLPPALKQKCEDLAVDVVGLCFTARNEDYVKASLAGWDDDGPCTAIGHARTLSAAGAAFVNGTAAHGEDFDDTFEGGPVHAGAVIVPAVLAACERHNPDGRPALLGIAVGAEVMCRLSLVAPMRTHKAGFHPTAIFGAMGAAAGVAAATRIDGPADRRCARRRRLDGERASSNIWRKAPGPSGCTLAGRRNPGCAPRCWRALASAARARCSKAPTGSFTASPTPPRATTRRSPAISGSAG